MAIPIRRRFLDLLLLLIPDYVLGRTIYRYQSLSSSLNATFFPSHRTSLRNVEYGFVITALKQLRKSGGRRILDVGCSESFFPYELMGLGLDVHGLDIESHVIKKTSFRFQTGDITKTSFPNGYFHYVVMVSTLEHVGIGAYRDPVNRDGDLSAIREIRRILSPKGYLLITVPYTCEFRITWQRIYDYERLMAVLDGLFVVLKEDFFVPTSNFRSLGKDLILGGGKWIRATKEEAERVNVSTACIVLQRK
jgi:SAM-dependent methyltransferase